MTLNENAFYLVFSLLAGGLIAWGLIQRLRGRTPTEGDAPRDGYENQSEGLAAIASGVVMALSVLADWWFTTPR